MNLRSWALPFVLTVVPACVDYQTAVDLEVARERAAIAAQTNSLAATAAAAQEDNQ